MASMRGHRPLYGSCVRTLFLMTYRLTWLPKAGLGCKRVWMNFTGFTSSSEFEGGKMKFKDILVTGGAGFIGSHLSEALLKKGCRVTVIDDLSTGQWSNVGQLEDDPNFRIIITSAADRDTVEEIFHPTDVVLKMCSKYRRPALITSTSEVYGKSIAIPFREDEDVIMGPTEKRRWAYACAKALDEFIALAHFYETSLPVFIVRLFNTAGPRQVSQYGMVLPSFVRQALADEPITVYGDGSQQRCFCSVYDVVEGLISLPCVPR